MRFFSKRHSSLRAAVEPDARQRVLAAAEKLFAEKGVAATSIRDLVREAGVNVAAINYYFGSKENLYLETLRSSFSNSRELLPVFETILKQAQETGTQEAALQAIGRYIEEFIRSLFESDESNRHVCLMMREMSDPTPALDVVVEEFIVPKFKVLQALIAQARPDLDPAKDVPLHVLSIVGQCLHYHFTLPVILKLLKRKKMTEDLIKQVSKHVADFSLRALRA
ncbi:MAG: CerR family C-terminal domain-containing protein [Acidobacteriota bacterium]